MKSDKSFQFKTFLLIRLCPFIYIIRITASINEWLVKVVHDVLKSYDWTAKLPQWEPVKVQSIIYNLKEFCSRNNLNPLWNSRRSIEAEGDSVCRWATCKSHARHSKDLESFRGINTCRYTWWKRVRTSDQTTNNLLFHREFRPIVK